MHVQPSMRVCVCVCVGWQHMRHSSVGLVMFIAAADFLLALLRAYVCGCKCVFMTHKSVCAYGKTLVKRFACLHL